MKTRLVFEGGEFVGVEVFLMRRPEQGGGGTYEISLQQLIDRGLLVFTDRMVLCQIAGRVERIAGQLAGSGENGV